MVLEVSDVGVATSGRYERGDHIIDPRTGQPATGLMSVTVVADDLALADGYATAALVLGEEGPAWLAERSLAAVAISDDGTAIVTDALQRYRVTDGVAARSGAGLAGRGWSCGLRRRRRRSAPRARGGTSATAPCRR